MTPMPGGRGELNLRKEVLRRSTLDDPGTVIYKILSRPREGFQEAHEGLAIRARHSARRGSSNVGRKETKNASLHTLFRSSKKKEKREVGTDASRGKGPEPASPQDKGNPISQIRRVRGPIHTITPN